MLSSLRVRHMAIAKRGLWDEIGGYDDDNVYIFLIPLASTSSGNDHIIYVCRVVS